MLQNLLNNKLKVLQIIVLVILLALIRGFENELFYDPFLKFFRSEKNNVYPSFDIFRLCASLFLRYGINSIISLVILYLIFAEKAIVRFSAIMYACFFVFLMFLFLIFLFYFDESNKMV